VRATACAATVGPVATGLLECFRTAVGNCGGYFHVIRVGATRVGCITAVVPGGMGQVTAFKCRHFVVGTRFCASAARPGAGHIFGSDGLCRSHQPHSTAPWRKSLHLKGRSLPLKH
jgi:hypothetical protein